MALSGGVDSSVVAYLARQALGVRAVAVTLVGPAVSTHEVDRARRAASEVGIDHHLLPIDPTEEEAYSANPSNRCYFCRRTETQEILRWSGGRGYAQYLDGVQVDDLGDDRPGLRAMAEAGFRHPLVEAAWGKTEVRQLARTVGLSNWDEPSDACLASRVSQGHRISPALLGRIERSESAIREMGFRRVRLRTDGSSARVEVDPPEVERLLHPETASEVRSVLAREGFDVVTLDPGGYRPKANG